MTSAARLARQYVAAASEPDRERARQRRAGIVRLAMSLGVWEDFQEECWALEAKEYA